MFDRSGTSVEMKNRYPIALAFLLAACNDRPPAPTTEQNRQLDEAENMLDEEAANEKGPATEAADPNSN